MARENKLLHSWIILAVVKHFCSTRNSQILLGKWRHEDNSGQRKLLERCCTITSNIQLVVLFLLPETMFFPIVSGSKSICIFHRFWQQFHGFNLQIKTRNPDADVPEEAGDEPPGQGLFITLQPRVE